MRYNLVMLCHWHQCQCHIMLMDSSMAPFHSLCQNDWNEVQYDFLVMCCHWHWHKQHVMLMALSITSLHFLDQDDQNEVQHDFSGHLMPLALMLASQDVTCIVKGTTTSLTSRQSKCGATWIFGHVTQLILPLAWHNATGVGVTLCHWHQCQCHVMLTAS